MSDSDIPFVGEPNESARPKRALALGFLGLVVLGFAFLIQLSAVLFDVSTLRNPIVNSLFVGLLLVIAVQIKPLDQFRGPAGQRVLRMIGLIVPVVDRYVAAREREAAQQAARAKRVRTNSSRIANLQQVVALNGLTAIPEGRVAQLGARDDKELEVDEMIAGVVDTVFSDARWSSTAPRSVELREELLGVLHRDATLGQSGQLWTQPLAETLIDPLADVLVESPRVRRTAAPRSQVVDELKTLQLEYTTAKLLDRLSVVPTDAATRMRRVFERYSILDLAGVTWSDHDWDQIQNEALARGGNQAKRCADICAQRLVGTQREPSSRLLRLLYFEAFSPPTDGYWNKHKTELLTELSELIEDSHVLPDFVKPDFRRAPTLHRLLDAHLSYSLPVLRGEVAALDRLRRVLDDYREFLVDHGLAPASPTVPADEVVDRIAKYVECGLPQGERGVERIGLAESEAELLFGYGTEMVGSTCDDIQAATWSLEHGRSPLPAGTTVPTSFCEAVSLVALHLRVCEEEMATSQARVALAHLTRRHGTDEAALVLAAHSIVGEDAADTPFHLHDVLTRWADVLDRARADDPGALAQNIRHAHHRLKNAAGRRQAPSTDEATRTTIQSVADQVVEFRGALDGLERLLQDRPVASTSPPAPIVAPQGPIGVPTATTDRPAGDTAYHDVREDEWLVRPYLITYDNDAGPLAELVDSLAWPDANQRATLAELGVRQHVDEQPKYRFANLTRQARLGFLPRSMPFDEFLAEFDRDLEIVLSNRGKILPYRLVQPGTTTSLMVEGPTPIEVAAIPRHGACVLHPHTGEIEYTPFPDDYRGPDRLIVDDADGDRHVVRLAVRPDLRQIEVTLSRIHLAQFAELVVDHDEGTIRRMPSVENVLTTLAEREQLAPIEIDIIKRHLVSV